MDLESVKIKVIFDGKDAQMGLRKFNKIVGNIGKDTKTVDRSFKTLGSTLRHAGLIGRALGIGAVALTMKSFAESAHRAAEEVRQLSYVSARTGVSVQRLSKTGAALESIGIKAGTYQQAISMLSGGVSRLSLGDASTVSTLAAMGITPYRNGQQISGEELFAGVADYAKRQAMAGERNKNAARELLMQMGFLPELIEKMWGGSEEFFRITEEQSKKVGSLSDEEIRRLEELKKWTDELSTATKITATKLGVLAFGPLTDFGKILTDIVKGVGGTATAVSESEGASKIVGGVANFLLGTKVMPWLNAGVHKLLSPIISSNSLFGSVARGTGALTETVTGLASKGLAYANLYQGSSMVAEGMFDFWKGNDKASRWVYDNISAPIGKFLVNSYDSLFDVYVEGSARRFEESGGMDALIKNAWNKQLYSGLPPTVGENWDRGNSGDVRIDIKQEFNGSVEPDIVKGATQEALDLSLKDVNLM